MAKQTPEEKLNKKEVKFKAKQPKQKAQTAFKAIVEPSVPENMQVNASVKPKYRYYCDFCSHNAFTADYRGEGLIKVCTNCNKLIKTKITNYLPNN